MQLIYRSYSSKCNETHSLGMAVKEGSSNELVAFIGPACSEDVQIVGRLASFWGIPLITGLGDVITGDRNSYTTLIRTSYDLKDKAKAILAFLGHHNWYHFGVIFRYQDIFYSTLANELLALLKDKKQYKKFACTCRESVVRDQNKTITSNLHLMMMKIKTCARSIDTAHPDCHALLIVFVFTHTQSW